ncbi:MAG: hypothetical protein ABSB58_01200 [Gemmatimonadales bacterium]
MKTRLSCALALATLSVAVLALPSCKKDSTSARVWSVTWSAVIEGGTGQIDSLTWKENTAQYSMNTPSISWFWTAPLPAGQSAFLRVRGSTTSPAVIHAGIHATAADMSAFARDTTCSGSGTVCQIGPVTLP